MKGLLFLITLITISLCQKKYTLTIYESPDCNYCKFAANQIRQIVKQYHWQNLLQVINVDCEKTINQCKINLNTFSLIMRNHKNQKLGEIEGVRSKLFFRDWISQFVTKNPIQIQEVSKPNEKYKRIIVKNPQEVQQFFKLYSQSKNKIRQNKLDIIKQAHKPMKQPQKNNQKTKQQISKQEVKKPSDEKQMNEAQSTESMRIQKQSQTQRQQYEQDDHQQQRNQQQKNVFETLRQQILNLTNFRADVLGLTMIGVCICILIICIKVKRTSSTHRNHRSVRIPVEEDEAFR